MTLKTIYEKYAGLLVYCFEFSIVVVALALKVLCSVGLSKTIIVVSVLVIALAYILMCTLIVDKITKKKVKSYLVKSENPIMEVEMCDSLRYKEHKDYIDVKIIVTNLKVFGREL